jgi:hypothetical protein
VSSRFWQVLRTIHIHLSLASLVLLLFFGVTGVLLVHADTLGIEIPRTERLEGTLSAEELRGDRLTIVEALRKHGAIGVVCDYEDADDQIRIQLDRPSQTCDATVDKQTGKFELAIVSRGVYGLMFDLHRGKGSHAWWFAIDLAGVLWIFVAITGLVLWMQLKKRRRVGLFWLFAGTVLSWICYIALAP